jgi:threonine/homoserine/homoserine lactone efflux protein
MDPATFLTKGLVIGFSIAAPVGPIGLLCIRRTLAGGMALGFASGLGAAVADAFYGAVAAFGLAAVSDLLVSQQGILRLVGGLFLLYLGIQTFRAKPATEAAQARAGAAGTFGAFLSTAALTVTNPATILSFVAVFGALGLGGSTGGTGSALAMVLGVFLGSALWWLGLSFGVSFARRQVTPAAMAWINRLSGGILCAFAFYALGGLIA